MPLPYRTHLAVTPFATCKAINIHVLPNVPPYILVKGGRNALRINHEESYKQSTVASNHAEGLNHFLKQVTET